jgi:hypothetical protein
MKKIITLFVVLFSGVILFSSFYAPFKERADKKEAKKTNSYIIIAWNDLGMHCSNKYFGNFAVLPPYNTQHAQALLVGTSTTMPEVITTGYTVTYEIPGNTYSVGKTDFWTYANALFGVTLANNIGLTGVGLTGSMTFSAGENFFHVEGIPVTPYTDANLVTESPYQLALIKLFDGSSNLIASTQSVIPVSNELSCVSAGCHSSEQGILNSHESVPGFNPSVKPILCANCHRDNALGKPGTVGTPAFSEAIHLKHGGITNDCYKCHPGPTTQCFRDVMKADGMTCTDCHGSVTNVGQTIENGRQDWLEEPTCGAVSCHGSNYAPEPSKLYRNSKGHGGMFCSSCHGSPHAILPSLQANDNQQNLALQGYVGTLNKCTVCHGVNPTGAGPHGIMASEIEYQPQPSAENSLYDAFPNPATTNTNIPFDIKKKTDVTLKIYDTKGNVVKLILNRHLLQGSYSVNISTIDLVSGIYFYTLQTEEKTFCKKLVIRK